MFILLKHISIKIEQGILNMWSGLFIFSRAVKYMNFQCTNSDIVMHCDTLQLLTQSPLPPHLLSLHLFFVFQSKSL